MAAKFRNPFRLRYSEKIENDSSFLKLFSPEVFDLLDIYNKEGDLWDNFVLIRSSPGAGKTSLLRIFEPASLHFIYNHRYQEPYKELFSWLKRFNAIDDSGVKLLSIYIKCTRNYEILDDLQFNHYQKRRLFFSILNARMILAALKGVSALLKTRFPEDLKEISVNINQHDSTVTSLPTSCTGLQLYEWANDIEKKIDHLLDSFIPAAAGLEGHDELYALSIIQPDKIMVEGRQLCEKVLFTFDDSHKFSTHQRNSLIRYFSEERLNKSVWMAERLETISDLRSFQDRDYINLENHWRDNQGKFKKILQKISSKRATESTENVNSFEEHLTLELDEEKYRQKLTDHCNAIINRLKNLCSFTNKYDLWLDEIEMHEGSIYEKALLYQKAEIVINRVIGKIQLAFEFPLEKEELYDKMDASVEAAAKLFVCHQSNIPYYFGFNNIALLSSNNIEQFLSFSAPLFEGMISNEISGNEINLSEIQQERIINKVVAKKWNELKILIPDSDYVIRFLLNLGKYCQEVTNKPSASYAPGINGFAIHQRHANSLLPEGRWDKDPIYCDLHEVLATCLAFNLLEVKITKQGAKDQEWEVFYLNKWLCIRFKLPLSSGGWNKITPDMLLKWTRNRKQ